MLIDFPDAFAPSHAAGLPLDEVNDQKRDCNRDQNDKVLGGGVECHEIGPLLGGSGAGHKGVRLENHSSAVGAVAFPA